MSRTEARQARGRAGREAGRRAEVLAAGRAALNGAAVRLDLIALAPGRLPRHIPDAWKRS
ncbi:MAG: hypothetical protein E8A12_07945 [Phenylobacterium sp.]|nr:MAG: hypothetical protein E8A12_07945 [Phenylobacterium sp.]